jgi:hydrogenase maturation protein HypF
MRTQIVPDAATCPACLAEMNNPAGAPLPLSVYQLHPLRAAVYHYSRHALRPAADRNGAVPSFPACAAEYRDPADRRFHAQPVACPDCGPRLEWRGPRGIYLARPRLGGDCSPAAGDIVAVKGWAVSSGLRCRKPRCRGDAAGAQASPGETAGGDAGDDGGACRR